MSLKAQRWQRVRALFERYIVLDDEERVRLLEEVRNEDEGLIRELRHLLDLDARDDWSMEPPDRESFGETLAAQAVGRRIGPWRLEAVLGSGGMSTVYLASRTEVEFEQRAALKLVKRGMDTDDILRRFVNERQVLADLDHPGIARLLDGGATDDGLPYLVMEYVRGTPVDRYCEEHRLDVEARLRLFLSICDPVQHAHEHGVIHRDLKPANILVTAEGRPKLLDFGIAKVLDTTASSGTVDITATEVRLMTPEYASPEQVRGAAIGPPSDVYSLGVVLYELLTGHRPYPLTTRLRHDVERAICEFQPPRPSAAIGSRPDSRRLRSRLAGDLDTIVLMALRKEPERRYASVRELSEDIERSLAGRPVLARPDTWRYRTSKFVRRNKVVVGAAFGIILALTVGLVTSINFWIGEASARAKTAESERRSRAMALAGAAAKGLDEDTMLALLLAREAVRLDRTPETLSQLHEVVGFVRERSVFHHDVPLREAFFSPDGDAVIAGAVGEALLWDREGNLTRIEHRGGEGLTAVRFSPSGEYILTSSCCDGTARLFDREGKEVARFAHGNREISEYPEGTQAVLWTAEFSPDPDGQFVLTAGADGIARVWNRDDAAEPWAVLRGHTGPIRCATFSPDGTHILTASEDKTGRVWRFSPQDGTAECVSKLEGHEGRIHHAEFSPDGKRIVTVSGDSIYGYSWKGGGKPDRTARVWDMDGREIRKLGGHHPEYEIEWATFSPSGTEILTGSSDKGGRLWDLQGHVLHEYPVPSSSSMTYMCSFSSDGHAVGFGCMDGSAWVYEVSGGLIGTLRGHDDEVVSLRFSRDGRSIVTASIDGTARIWSIWDETLPTICGHRGEVRAAFSPDGEWIATSGWGETARIWDARGRSFVSLLGHEDSILSIRFDREGTQVVTASADCTARTWAFDGRPLQVFSHPGVGMVKTAAFSPDGKLIATGCRDSTVWVWRRDGSVLERFEVGAWVSHLEFHPDGERLLVARGHAPVLLLTLESGSIRELPFDGYHATFTPSGEILVGCRENGRVVRLSADGDLLSEFPAHDESLNWVEMSPKEDRIVTASNDGTAKIWSVDGTLQSILRGHAGVVTCVSFSPDGDRVVTGFGDGTARTWLVYEESLLELADARATRDFSDAEFRQYEELLGVPATEAKELVDGLFEELGSKVRVLERLRRDGDLDAALRETALRFAEALSDTL